jgi:hypothetical protein
MRPRVSAGVCAMSYLGVIKYFYHTSILKVFYFKIKKNNFAADIKLYTFHEVTFNEGLDYK